MSHPAWMERLNSSRWETVAKFEDAAEALRLLPSTGRVLGCSVKMTFSRHAPLQLPRLRQMKEVVRNIQTGEAEPNKGQTRCGIVPTIKLHEAVSDLPCSPLSKKIETKPLTWHAVFAKLRERSKMKVWAKLSGSPMPVPNSNPSPGWVRLPRLFGIGIGGLG